MTELVWVSDWQIQCCGEEFAVGDQVAWPLLPVNRADTYFAPLLGGELAAGLTHSYEGHEEPEVPDVSGTVLGIRTVACRMAPLPPPADQRELHVVAGSGRLQWIDAIDQWLDLHGDPSGLHFAGWLVDLDLEG